MRKWIYYVAIILIVFLIFSFRNSEPSEEIPISIQVSDNFQINLDDGTLNYGSILAGMISTRNISITNPYSEERSVVLKVEGLEDWISLSEGAFILDGNSEKIVSVNIEVPIGAEDGMYDSVLKIYLH